MVNPMVELINWSIPVNRCTPPRRSKFGFTPQEGLLDFSPLEAIKNRLDPPPRINNLSYPLDLIKKQ